VNHHDFSKDLKIIGKTALKIFQKSNP
jgi:hypothetical protein